MEKKIDRKTPQSFLAAAVPLVLTAGQKAAAAWADFDRRNSLLKDKREIVTEIDRNTEKMLVKGLARIFPEHSFLGEEFGSEDKGSDYLWIIDPIDGTTNFSIHNPLWSVSVGLAYKGEIVAGLVYVPLLDELYSAVHGAGARMNGRRLRLGRELPPNKLIHTFCHGNKPAAIETALAYYCRQKRKALDCRQLGSAAIELCFVAAGRVDSIVIPGVRSWDVAAGSLIAAEAGAAVIDLSGKPWHLESPEIIACHPRIAGQVSKALKAAAKEAAGR